MVSNREKSKTKFSHLQHLEKKPCLTLLKLCYVYQACNVQERKLTKSEIDAKVAEEKQRHHEKMLVAETYGQSKRVDFKIKLKNSK